MYLKVPTTKYECKEEQVLAGQKYVPAEKKEDSYGHGQGYGHGYGQGYGHGYGHGHGHVQSYGHYEPQYKTVKRCYPKVSGSLRINKCEG